MPKLQLTVNLQSAQSGQQGTVTVTSTLGRPRAAAALLHCNFSLPQQDLRTRHSHSPRADKLRPSPSQPETFSPPSRQGGMAAFQTATTAGTIVFSAEAGEVSDQKSVPSRRP